MKVWGVDVSKNYIIAYNGEKFIKVPLEKFDSFVSTLRGDVLVLEQTGVYSLPLILRALRVGCKVFVAHTTALKRLRDFKGVSKNDVKDAELLRELYFQKRFIYEFNENKFWLRFAFFNYRRAVKEFSQTVNRLRAFLYLVKPELANFKNSKKGLEELKSKVEKRAKQSYVYGYVYRLVERLLLLLEDRKQFERELHRYLVLHPDYEILRTFPSLGDLVIAGLVSTYWDVERFQPEWEKTFSKDGVVKFRKVKAVDKFVAYLLGASKRYQSGKMDRSKAFQKRPYILGLLFPVYIQAGRKNSVYYPFFEYLKQQGLNGYKTYRKFITQLLRWVYLAVKHRWTFKQVMDHKAKNTLDKELKEVYIKILERV